MKVYFISGLGANERAFSFLDLSFCEPVFISWLKPLLNETLKEYAARLRESIPEEHPVIVGISFGGMLATEMAKNDPGIKAIIISSNKISAEFPAYLRMWRYFPVYKWTSANVIKSTGKLIKDFIGPRGKAQRKVFLQILNETDAVFTKWAIGAILNWSNAVVPPNVIHIHGTADTLLPYRYVKAAHTIKHGTHLMIMDKATEISALLKQLIADSAEINPKV